LNFPNPTNVFKASEARMKRFKLQIEMGNAAMETLDDIADALEDTAQKLRQGKPLGPIFDLNGNKVGNYEGK
jgi:hypothetical protein